MKALKIWLFVNLCVVMPVIVDYLETNMAPNSVIFNIKHLIVLKFMVFLPSCRLCRELAFLFVVSFQYWKTWNA
jgi:hypothetical protein